MAQMIKLVALVAISKMAEALDSLADIAENVTMESIPKGVSMAAAHNGDDDDDVTPPVAARRRDVRPVQTAHRASTVAQRPARLAGKVIYTPAGTARQIDKMLADLRGVKTMRALVLKDLVKHPGSSNREMRERLAAKAAAAGLSIESIDNVIWQAVNKGQIAKEVAAE